MITSITLRNFKTFRDSTRVEFGPVTIVLGANGSGKSNLFDAMRFLKAVGDGRSVRDAIEGHASPSTASTVVTGVRGGGAAVTHFLSGSTEFEVEVQMTVGARRIEYSLTVDAARYRVAQEDLRALTHHPGQYVYSTKPESGPLEQDPDSPVVVARFHKETRGLNPRRDFSPYDFILTQFTSRKAESRINEEIADLVRREFASIRLLELRPEVLRQYSPLGRSDLGEHGENFAAALWELVNDAEGKHPVHVRERTGGEESRFQTRSDNPEAHDRLDAINAWLTELTPVPIETVKTIQAPTGEVIFAVKEAGFGRDIAAPSLSDGTLRFAALTLAAVGAQGRQTLVVEELENGISPSRLNLLVRMLEQTAESSPEIQVIASTHSPAVLDDAAEQTRRHSVVFGWDSETMSSRPIAISRLPSLDDVLADRSLGDLQAEGWLQLAADFAS